MPILPLDHPEPFAATLGVMLYPGTEGTDPLQARAYAAQYLAKPLQRFHEAGHTLPYDSLARISEDAGEHLTDFGKRRWEGTATGEMFQIYVALAEFHKELASWNNATHVAEKTAARFGKSGSRANLFAARSRFMSVAHLWGAFCIRGRRFKEQPKVGYLYGDDFWTFVTEAEILREWGQNWRPPRKNSKPPLPPDVWRVPTGWEPPSRQRGWPAIGFPTLVLPTDLLEGLKPAGRPRARP